MLTHRSHTRRNIINSQHFEESRFETLRIQHYNSMLSTNSTTVDACNTSTSANNMSRIFMFLFLSTRGILGIQSCSGNPRFQWFFIFTAPHFDIFTWRYNWFNVITNRGPDPCSEFSSDLRAHCSAILNSRLLRIVHNMGFY